MNKRDEGWYGCEAEDVDGNVAKSELVRLLVEGRSFPSSILILVQNRYFSVNYLILRGIDGYAEPRSYVTAFLS